MEESIWNLFFREELRDDLCSIFEARKKTVGVKWKMSTCDRIAGEEHWFPFALLRVSWKNLRDHASRRKDTKQNMIIVSWKKYKTHRFR